MNVACRMHRLALAEPCSKPWCNTAVEDGLVHSKACIGVTLRLTCGNFALHRSLICYFEDEN